MRAGPVVVPGRVNLIGEHTDYNAGLALPFAIDLTLTATAAPAEHDDVCVTTEFGTWCDSQPATDLWTCQARQIVRAVHGRRADVRIESSIPTGAGLSSSAAYVSAIALALGHHDDALRFATLVRDCEVAAGNNVGLLDPLAVLAGRRDHAMLIDFATSNWEHVPLPPTLGVTIVHSGVARSLSDTAYLRRREECHAARSLVPSWPPLASDLDAVADETLRRRLRHIATENERVRAAVALLGDSDVIGFGALVDASHASLRDDFEVSLPVVDRLVERLRGQEGVVGVRMVGGGFGGCVLVVHDASIEIDAGAAPSWHVRPSDGALARLPGG